ncbi:hypothetical protein LCGC14_2907330 [marine sediment metagenome]|uniref:Uncharacterized protein n=1 Tax=marine sediment metagenome TaxID=412755 RepID=A0A0F8XT37_9ZZZZ
MGAKCPRCGDPPMEGSRWRELIVNAHPIAVKLAHAVLQEDRDRSDWLGKIIRLAEEFKKVGRVAAGPNCLDPGEVKNGKD